MLPAGASNCRLSACTSVSIDELAVITAPTLIFAGMDERHPAKLAEDLANILPHGQLAPTGAQGPVMPALGTRLMKRYGLSMPATTFRAIVAVLAGALVTCAAALHRLAPVELVARDILPGNVRAGQTCKWGILPHGSRAPPGTPDESLG